MSSFYLLFITFIYICIYITIPSSLHEDTRGHIHFRPSLSFFFCQIHLFLANPQSLDSRLIIFKSLTYICWLALSYSSLLHFKTLDIIINFKTSYSSYTILYTLCENFQINRNLEKIQVKTRNLI